MKQEVQVPEIGESVSSGILSAWLVDDGALVSEGDEIFELETDKATLSVPAPAGGKLSVQAQVDDEVEVGQVVGYIDTDAAEAEPASSTEEAKPAAGKEETPEKHPSDGKPVEEQSPAVRRILTENNLDPSTIQGTGKDGRITKEDALKAAEGADEGASDKAAPKPKASDGGGASADGRPKNQSEVTADKEQTREKMSKIRQRIAANLVQSKQSSAHLTTFNEVDMSAVMAMRKDYKAEFESKHGVRLGFMSFFIKAAQKALEEYPEVNAFIDGDEIVYNRFYHIGVALSSDRGLLTPVVRNAAAKSFADIEAEIIDFAQRAKNKKLRPDELMGATFTITNGGVFGSLLSTPIPSPPQTGILGMHTIQKRPVVLDNDEIVVRPMMYLALTYDHRIIDGREAIGFLMTIKRLIEDPRRLLLDV